MKEAVAMQILLEAVVGEVPSAVGVAARGNIRLPQEWLNNAMYAIVPAEREWENGLQEFRLLLAPYNTEANTNNTPTEKRTRHHSAASLKSRHIRAGGKRFRERMQAEGKWDSFIAKRNATRQRNLLNKQVLAQAGV